MVETTLNSLIYLGFNCKAAPLDDLNVRQAIAYAIDKQKLVQVALGGIGEAAFSPLASTLPGFDASLKPNELSFDLQKSAELLKQSGYRRQEDGTWISGDGGAGKRLSLDLLISTRAPNEALATVIQEHLKMAGLQVNIRALESAAASEAATKGEYQMILWRYDWNDADVLMIYLSTDRIGRTNRSFYSNPELDALLVDAAREVDGQKRNQLYSRAQQILMAEVPWVPLYTPKDYIVLRNTIQGVVVGPMGRLLLNEASLQK